MDSRREYVEQIGHYKTFQGRPVPSRKEAVCPQCGKTFVVSREGHRFCNRECRFLARRKANPTLDKQCEQCGEQFTARVKTAKFCSTTCRTANHRKRKPK